MEEKQTTFDEISAESGMDEIDSFSDPETKAEFIECAETYAAKIASEQFSDLTLETVEWEISTRAKRTAGRTKYNTRNGDITVRLAWAAYEKLGWEDMRETIRHELIHVWQYQTFGTADHGVRFRAHADELDTEIHCKRFKEPKYWLSCERCGKRDPRYKRSKTVKHPERYSCQCGGDLKVEATEQA